MTRSIFASLPVLNRLLGTSFSSAPGATGTGQLLAGGSELTASLGADVDLNNTGNYFDGPSIAQGTTGTWWVSGTVTVLDTAGPATFLVKLWDGTTVISSTVATSPGANNPIPVMLSGYLSSPAGNIRMSVRDISATTGKIKFNSSGESKDSTITAYRIG